MHSAHTCLSSVALPTDDTVKQPLAKEETNRYLTITNLPNVMCCYCYRFVCPRLAANPQKGKHTDDKVKPVNTGEDGWKPVTTPSDIYIYIYIHTHTCMYTHTYIHTYIHTYVRTYVRTYVHTYTCRCRCTYTHTHTHTYTYT